MAVRTASLLATAFRRRPGEPLEATLARRRFWQGALPALLIAAALWAAPDAVQLPASVWRLASVTLLYVIAAMGLNLVFGMAGQVTLGPAATFAVGAYVAGVLTARAAWDPWPAIGVAIAGATLAGVLIGMPALRVGGFYLAMVTAIAAAAIPAVLNLFRTATGGQDGLVGIPGLTLLSDQPLDAVGRYRVALAVTLIAALLVANASRSAWGRWFRCLTASEVGTTSLGVSVYQAKVVAFLFSAIFGGLAGGLYAHFQRVLSPMEFGFDLSLNLFASVVIGGLGTLWGPVLGTAVFVLGQHYLLPSAWGPLWAQVVYGLVLIAVMVLIPDGIAPALGGLGRSALGAARRPAAGPPVARASGADIGALRSLLASASRDPGGAAVLRAQGVSKRFGGVRALQDASVEVAAGRITALIGPNGSGKTTLLNICSGLVSADGGRVWLGSEDTSGLAAYRRARAGLGRTLQHPVLFPQLTGGQSVMAGHGARRPSPWAALLGLPSSADHERDAAARAEAVLGALGAGHLVTKPGRAMSLAESRILDLARALALDPRVLLLDEPAAGLDLDEVEVVGAMVRAARDAGVGVLLVDHDVSFVTRLADRVTVLDQGTVIYDGGPERVRTDPRVAAAYFGELDPGAAA